VCPFSCQLQNARTFVKKRPKQLSQGSHRHVCRAMLAGRECSSAALSRPPSHPSPHATVFVCVSTVRHCESLMPANRNASRSSVPLLSRPECKPPSIAAPESPAALSARCTIICLFAWALPFLLPFDIIKQISWKKNQQNYKLCHTVSWNLKSLY